ncbi:hydroxymethylglutaryl-CoA reductase, degradative [Aquimarina agarilytica]|uniref:hydroxymethylglutaryl-CoA reductase, degradative n=1 Tax=Aquimarina agarilytica TaxID=1087449 RepID=UPI0002885AC3|nr:hydroxymethylglutaryl-CoA reductase, degradative [Aquimarina agarilytica]
MTPEVTGFSKLNKHQKIDWLVANHFQNTEKAKQTLHNYWNANEQLQQLHDEFAENTLSNFYLPFSIAPNFTINNKRYTIPMTIEESSVVAAASNAAKFWNKRGGFKATVINTEKIGQVHFSFSGKKEHLNSFFKSIKSKLIAAITPIEANMKKRGGGLLDIQLRDKTQELANYYQLHCTFETVDAMGANFINTCLEKFAEVLQIEALEYDDFSDAEKNIEIIMSILSNYVPNCVVKAEVSCKVSELPNTENLSSLEYAEKFVRAINIAEKEPYRAVTHNKGIMNGIDAVVIATGNDFRAIEASAHAYAAKNGSYSSLTHAHITNDVFTYYIEIPLAIGTIGGLTSLHPMVKLALELLEKPNAKQLMEIIAVAGLAQNFGAVNSLITTGIQKGHMKMHLLNILNQHHATAEEKQKIVQFFTKNTVTHSEVIKQLALLRA